MSNSTLIKLLFWLLDKCLLLVKDILSALFTSVATTAVTCISSKSAGEESASTFELVSDAVLSSSESSSELVSESERAEKFSPAARFFKGIFCLYHGGLVW